MKSIATVFATVFCLCGGIAWPCIMKAENDLPRSSALRFYDMPSTWQYEPAYAQQSPGEDSWWKQYQDSTLNMLIAKAEANNYNASAALKRIKIAREGITAARSALYPTLTLSAGYNLQQEAGTLSSPIGASHTSSYFSIGADASWEVDIFGRVASQVKAVKAGVGVSKAEYDGIIVSLCSQVAAGYFQLRTLQAEYEVAKTHIESQEKIVRMTEVRLEAGIADALEVSQAKTVLLSTKASLPTLESGIRTTANAIAVLTGEYPVQLADLLLVPQELTPAPPVLTTGTPADILRRRPDIVEAEMQLAQYAAHVGIAKKDFLPTLILTGSISTAAHNAGNLFGAHSLQYGVSPTLSWTAFDGFSRKAALAEARLDFEASLDNYNMTVLNAVEEVENAISKYNSAVQQTQALEELVKESAHSYNLSVDLYKQGLTNFINVMNSQLTYLENQNSLVVARGNVYDAQVSLYKALGGGYNK